MNAMLKAISAALTLALLSGAALAKLPPPSEEAVAKAAAAKAKAAWSGKVGAYKLCLAQDRVVARYKKQPVAAPAKAGKGAPPVAASACADPGPFVDVANQAAAPAAPAAPAQAAPANVASKKP